MKKWLWIIVSLCLAAAFLVGCTPQEGTGTDPSEDPDLSHSHSGALDSYGTWEIREVDGVYYLSPVEQADASDDSALVEALSVMAPEPFASLTEMRDALVSKSISQWHLQVASTQCVDPEPQVYRLLSLDSLYVPRLPDPLVDYLEEIGVKWEGQRYSFDFGLEHSMYIVGTFDVGMEKNLQRKWDAVTRFQEDYQAEPEERSGISATAYTDPENNGEKRYVLFELTNVQGKSFHVLEQQIKTVENRYVIDDLYLFCPDGDTSFFVRIDVTIGRRLDLDETLFAPEELIHTLEQFGVEPFDG